MTVSELVSQLPVLVMGGLFFVGNLAVQVWDVTGDRA